MTTPLPRAIAHFTMVEPLGSGGMGVVYRAFDPRLERAVAIKMLGRQQAGDDAVERFRREARAASALSHPNIVSVFDVGETDDGWFIAMELVAGESLVEWRGTAHSDADIVDAGGQIAEALAAAHDAGIVHRDVKPENVMRRPDGYVKLLDFGLARLATRESSTNLLTTEAGRVLGTLRYLSPEQANGDVVGPPSDVFSLGVVLYELLTGVHPFEAGTEIGVLGQIITRTPPSMRSVRPEIAESLDTLVFRMLDKQASERPTAADVADALHRELEQLGVSRRRTTVRAHGNAPLTSTRARIQARRSGVVVGHVHELGVLLAEWERARHGQGRLVAITGEAGIGKTTFVESAIGAIGDAVAPLIVRGRCSERFAGTEAFLPVLDALDRAATDDADGHFATMLAEVAPAWEAMRAHAEPVALGSQERLKREMLALLRRLTSSRPMVLFLDDVHWADTSTVDLLAYIGTHLSELAILVVVTYRAAELHAGMHPFLQVSRDLSGRGLLRELALSLLGPDDISRYLDATFAGHAFPAELSQRLYARTEGNALFLVDVLRWMSAQGVIAERDGAWRLTGDLRVLEQALPSSVRDMIERKISQIGESDRRLLNAAAVQGGRFDTAAIADALQMDEAELEDRLILLDRVYAFVRRQEERRYPDRSESVSYSFVHVLYQNVLNDGLTASRRAAWCRRLADFTERRARADAPELAAEIALLRDGARDHAASAHWYGVAAQRALGRFAFAEAAALATLGLAQVDALPEDHERDALELALQVVRGMVSLVRVGFSAAATAEPMERALLLCTRIGNAPALLPALWVLLLREVAHGTAERALALADQMEEASTGPTDNAPRALAALCRTGIYTHIGNAPAVHHWFGVLESLLDDEVRERLHRGFQPEPLMTVYSQRGRTLALEGRFDEAEAQLAAAVTFARSLRDPQAEPFVSIVAAEAAILQGEYTRAAGISQRAIAMAQEHGIASEQLWNTLFLCGAMVGLGQYAEVIPLAKGTLALMTEAGLHIVSARLRSFLAEALWRTGELAEAASVIEEGLAVVDAHGYREYEPFLWEYAARVLAERAWTGGSIGGCTRASEAVARGLARAEAAGTHALSARLRRAASEIA